MPARPPMRGSARAGSPSRRRPPRTPRSTGSPRRVLTMGALGGLSRCERIGGRWTDVPVVVMAAYGTVQVAIAAVRAGAYDFITKPIDVDTLVVTLERARERRALVTEVTRLRRAV